VPAVRTDGDPPVSAAAVVVDVRYVLGLRNIAEAAGVTYTSRSWLASVGYRF